MGIRDLFTRRPRTPDAADSPPQLQADAMMKPPPWPTLASDELRAAVMTKPFGVNIVVADYNPAVMTTKEGLAVPAVAITVPSGHTLDYAHPDHGFHGWVSPAPDRVLTLWADDLLTIAHGDVWRFVIDSDGPFERDWLEVMFPDEQSAAEGDFRPERAVVLINFDIPMPASSSMLTELGAQPLTLTHLADRRGAPAHER